VQIDLPGEPIVCINGGGGSTELCAQLPGNDLLHVFDFGAKNLADKFFSNSVDANAACHATRQLITDEFNKIDHSWIPGMSRVVSIGGSVWAAVAFLRQVPEDEFQQLNGLSVAVDDLEQLTDEILNTPVEEMAARPFAPGVKRLQLLPAGLLVHTTLARLINKYYITISTRSVADAVLLEF
jgi:exopolyphosphatase/pppGpp-phosphohydrolase